MKVFGKIMLATIIILSSISLYIKPTTHAAEDKQWEKIKKRGELRVGLSADYAPYEFEHNVNGKTKYAGIDIELAKKIAKDNNLKLKIVNMQFDSLLGAIKTGKIDLIISGMTPTPEREKEVDFSNPYMTVTQKMIIKKANEDKLKTLDDFTNKRGRGTDKQGVIGAVECESGKVIAQKQDKFTFEELKAFLMQNTDFEKATLYTDDFTGYKPFKKIVSHAVINHSKREYAKNGIHTNTIEGFWGIFKRAIVGSYHKLSVKHLDAYIQECCFKYNNRNNMNMFDMLLINCVR